MGREPEPNPQTARVFDDLTGPGAVRIPDLSPPEARAAIERFIAKWDLDPQPGVGAMEDFDILGGAPDVALRSRLYRPAGKTGPLSIIVFVHAGGFVFGSIETHNSFCRLICARYPKTRKVSWSTLTGLPSGGIPLAARWPLALVPWQRNAVGLRS